MIYYSRTFTAFDRDYSTQIAYCYLVNRAVIEAEGVKDDFTSTIDRGALFRLNGGYVQLKFPKVEKVLEETGLTRKVYFRAKKNLEKRGVIGNNKIQVIDNLFPDPSRSKKHIQYFELIKTKIPSKRGMKHLSGKDLIIYSFICHRAILDGYTSIISYDNYICNQLGAEWDIKGDYNNPDRVAVYNAISNLKRMGLISRINGKHTEGKNRCYYITINNAEELSDYTDKHLASRYELSEEYKFEEWKKSLPNILEEGCWDINCNRVSVSEIKMGAIYYALFRTKKGKSYAWFIWSNGSERYENAVRGKNGGVKIPSFYHRPFIPQYDYLP